MYTCASLHTLTVGMQPWCRKSMNTVSKSNRFWRKSNSALTGNVCFFSQSRKSDIRVLNKSQRGVWRINMFFSIFKQDHHHSLTCD